MEWLIAPWPWYIGGSLLGLLVPFTLIWGGKQLGLSLSFKAGCAVVFGGVFKNNEFFTYDYKQDLWRLVYLTGIAIGGFVGLQLLSAPDYAPVVAESTKSALMSIGISDFNAIAPLELFTAQNGTITIGQILFLMSGGFLIGFGSRYANGCTSGHAIMGLSYFQIASLVAVIGFFTGGLIMTHAIMPYVMDFFLAGR